MESPPASRSERRRHARTPIGLPVRVHFAGHTVPVTVELQDVSPFGCYFRGTAAPPRAKLAFGFVLADRQICVAGGKVLRVDSNGFAATIDRSNLPFAEFIGGLSGATVAHAA